MGVDDHHCAASFSLFQSIGVPVEVSHNNIRVDLVFNQKLDSAISGYLDKFPVLLDVFERLSVGEAWTCSNNNDILALDLFLEDLRVKCLFLYHV